MYKGYKIYFNPRPENINVDNVKHLLGKDKLSSAEQRIINWFYCHPLKNDLNKKEFIFLCKKIIKNCGQG
jgi:hypothetical protein